MLLETLSWGQVAVELSMVLDSDSAYHLQQFSAGAVLSKESFHISIHTEAYDNHVDIIIIFVYFTLPVPQSTNALLLLQISKCLSGASRLLHTPFLWTQHCSWKITSKHLARPTYDI